MSEGDAERYWRGRARAVVRRVNLGWWTEASLPPAVIGLLVAAAAVIVWRSSGSFAYAWGWLAALVCGVLVLSGAFARWRSCSRFIALETGLARLDDRLALRNRLVSASCGVGPWPPPSEPPHDLGETAIPRWRLLRIGLPLGGAILIVVSAWLAPFPQPSADAALPPAEPGVWEEMDEWLALLREADLVEPESLDAVAEQIEELRSQPEEDWFSHGSLEASDTLRESLGRELRDLARDLGTLERDLEALRRFSSEMGDEAREALLREYDEAMQGLAANAMELNESLAAELAKLDPSRLGGREGSGALSAEELDALQQRLREGAQTLGGMGGLPALAEVDDLFGSDGLTVGSGGIGKDGESAPLTFGREQDLGTRQVEGVENRDLSRSALGDFVGLGETEHDDERLEAELQAGGAVGTLGAGGEAVWRDTLLPEEQSLLKRYFK